MDPNDILTDPDAAPVASNDPGSETRSPDPNIEAPDDGTGLGSEFQRRRLMAQQRIPEGLVEL
jgi:hypothetical protein